MIYRPGARLIIFSVVLLLLLAGTPYISNQLGERYTQVSSVPSVPEVDVKGWKRVTGTIESIYQPNIILPDLSQQSRYQSGEIIIDTFLYIYSNAYKGKEIIHHDNVLYQKKYWTMLKKGQVYLQNGNHKLEMNEVQLTRGKETRIIRYFYLVNGHFASSDTHVKLYELMTKLRGNPMDSRLYVFATSTTGNDSEISTQLDSFILEYYNSLQTGQ